MPTIILADAIDVLMLLSRVNYRDSKGAIAAIVLLLMVVNYAVNFLIIGYPSIRFGSVPPKTVMVDLVYLTLFGQLADRLGVIITLFCPLPILMPYVWACSNFLVTSLLILVLVRHFVRCRWQVETRTASWIILAAVAFTNPVGVWLALASLGVIG